jgi:hypothetical protein
MRVALCGQHDDLAYLRQAIIRHEVYVTIYQWFSTFLCSRHTWDTHFFTANYNWNIELKFIRVHLFLSNAIYSIKYKIIVKQKDDEV